MINKSVDAKALELVTAARAQHEMTPLKALMQATDTELLWALRRAIKIPVDSEEIEQCESGCYDPVVAHDVEGVPLCQGCYDQCVEDMKSIPTQPD